LNAAPWTLDTSLDVLAVAAAAEALDAADFAAGDKPEVVEDWANAPMAKRP